MFGRPITIFNNNVLVDQLNRSQVSDVDDGVYNELVTMGVEVNKILRGISSPPELSALPTMSLPVSYDYKNEEVIDRYSNVSGLVLTAVGTATANVHLHWAYNNFINKFLRKSEQTDLDFGEIEYTTDPTNFGFDEVFLELDPANILNQTESLYSPSLYDVETEWIRHVTIHNTNDTQWLQLISDKSHNPYGRRLDKRDAYYAVHVLTVADKTFQDIIDKRSEWRSGRNNEMLPWFEKYFIATLLHFISCSDVYGNNNDDGLPPFRLMFFQDIFDIKLFNSFTMDNCPFLDWFIKIDINRNAGCETFFRMIGCNNQEDVQLIQTIKQKFVFMQNLITLVKHGVGDKRNIKLYDIMYACYSVAWSMIVSVDGCIAIMPDRLRKFEVLAYDLGRVCPLYKGRDVVDHYSGGVTFEKHVDFNFIGTVIRGMPFVRKSFRYNGNEIINPTFFTVRDAHRCPFNTIDRINTEDFLKMDTKCYGWTVSQNYDVPWHKRTPWDPSYTTRGPIWYRVHGKLSSDSTTQIMPTHIWAYTMGRAFTLYNTGQGKGITWFDIPVHSATTYYKKSAQSLKTRVVMGDIYKWECRPNVDSQTASDWSVNKCGRLCYGIDEWLLTFTTHDCLGRNIYTSKDTYLQEIVTNSQYFEMYYSWDVNPFSMGKIRFSDTKELRSFDLLFLYFLAVRTIHSSNGISAYPDLKTIDNIKASLNFSYSDILFYIDTVMRKKADLPDAIKTALMYYPPRTHIHAFAGYSHEKNTESFEHFSKMPHILGLAPNGIPGFYNWLLSKYHLFYKPFKSQIAQPYMQFAFMSALIGFEKSRYPKGRDYDRHFNNWTKKIIEGNISNAVAGRIYDINDDNILTADEINETLSSYSHYDINFFTTNEVNPFRLNNGNHFYSVHGSSHQYSLKALKWYDDSVSSPAVGTETRTLKYTTDPRQDESIEGGGKLKENEPTYITMDTKSEIILKQLKSEIKQDNSEMSWTTILNSQLEFSINDYIDPLFYYSREKFAFTANNYFTQNHISVEDFLLLNKPNQLKHIRNIKTFDPIQKKKIKIILANDDLSSYVVVEQIKKVDKHAVENCEHLFRPLYLPNEYNTNYKSKTKHSIIKNKGQTKKTETLYRFIKQKSKTRRGTKKSLHARSASSKPQQFISVQS